MIVALTSFFDKAKNFLDVASLDVHAHVVNNLTGSPKVFISVDEEKAGVVFDLIKSSISYDGKLRDGGFGAVFSFTDKGFDDFIAGKSLAQCAFENILRTSGTSESLFLASLYLDELAKEVRDLNDSHSLH